MTAGSTDLSLDPMALGRVSFTQGTGNCENFLSVSFAGVTMRSWRWFTAVLDSCAEMFILLHGTVKWRPLYL